MAKKIDEHKVDELIAFLDGAIAEIHQRRKNLWTTEIVEEEDRYSCLDILPNQERAITIQRAREFVEGKKNKLHDAYIIKSKDGYEYECDAVFTHNKTKRTTTCTLVGTGTGYTRKKAVARCHPNEVFNEALGEVISLCMALEIDIPQEFLNAVQPDEKVVGQVVRWNGYSCKDEFGDTLQIGNKSVYGDGDGKCSLFSKFANESVIIDDTNAIYEEVDQVG